MNWFILLSTVQSIVTIGIQEVFDVVPVCPPGSHPWGSPAP